MSEIFHEEVIAHPGSGLRVATIRNGKELDLVLRVAGGEDCVLHWGICKRPGGTWVLPPDACRPRGTVVADGRAVRTPFALNEKGEREVKLHFDGACPARHLAFVLHLPGENRWLKNGGKDFSIELPTPGLLTPAQALAQWQPGENLVRQALTLDSGDRLATAVSATPDSVHVSLACDAELPLVLHWGVAWRFRHEWQLPPELFRPKGTSLFDEVAARTPFVEREGLPYLELVFRKPTDGPSPVAMNFVLFQPGGAAWLKCGGKELELPLFKVPSDPRLPAGTVGDLAEEIVSTEMGATSWTLMHRFNLCHSILDRAQDDEDALALLFVWLRYSATRQLDWQRNYNTKPRELAHAQDRLTRRLAGISTRHPLWARLMLTTLGRGGEGQRVRDEILHIMHRNNLKETSGSFIEQWHQKLHNNTTPDDVVICEAYLAYLSTGGNIDAFYETLEAKGVTRDRLKSFERPITYDPTFSADKKDALVREFGAFLTILKSVHSGTDLESAVDAARARLDKGLQNRLDALRAALRQKDAKVEKTAQALVEVRESLMKMIAAAGDEGLLRDLVFLDVALEQCLRETLERQSLSRFDREQIVELVLWSMRNLELSENDRELATCSRHWSALLALPQEGRDWALHAKSVADRVGRWLQGFTDGQYRRLQPKAEFLGEALNVEKWVVPLFSEEVIRGGAAFALALLLRHLDPLLRREAGLGGWQVISPAKAFGRVCVVDRLIDVQANCYAEPTVLVTDVVAGNEEVPEGVTAVITSDAPDLVSHSAVRARNAGVLFATCYDPEHFGRLKELKDRTVLLCVTPGGDVEYEESAAPQPIPIQEHAAAAGRPSVRNFSAWAVTQDQFSPELVGGKSNNLNGLRGRLPDWIGFPTSLALPFGVFEKTLADEANRAVHESFQALVAEVEQDPAAVLARLRQRLQELAPPVALKSVLLSAWSRAGLAPVPWELVWRGVVRVWASQWNDRAYLSRRARHVPHECLRMAVLIQQVIEAEYAFVIHTVNPITGNRDEILAEVVLGLGETLVGNYPGRALTFVCRKDDLNPEVHSYPGKSLGLYGKGVIFRSDSNGEDLEDYAGAGLYDSFLAEEPEQRLLDYNGEKLVWDLSFRAGLLRDIARVGLEVEKVLGSPQDIEGAVAGGRFHVVQTRPQVGLGNTA
jgi:alpha-glucan, water dikinase